MATYSQLWQVLTKLYGVKEPAGKGPMRARLQKLQQAGIPEGSNVGKGKRVNYTTTQIFQIVLCLEILALGLTPSLAYEFTLGAWQDVIEAIRRIRRFPPKKSIKQTNELFCITSNPTDEELITFNCFITNQDFIFEELSEDDWRRASFLNLSRLIELVDDAVFEIIGGDISAHE